MVDYGSVMAKAKQAEKRRVQFKALLTQRLILEKKTQKNLAGEIGISENSMSTKVNNYEAFTVGELVRVAEILHVKVGYLIGEN